MTAWWSNKLRKNREFLGIAFPTSSCFSRHSCCSSTGQPDVWTKHGGVTTILLIRCIAMYEHEYDAQMLILIIQCALSSANLSDCWWWWWLGTDVKRGALSRVVARIIPAPGNENDPALCNLRHSALLFLRRPLFCLPLIPTPQCAVASKHLHHQY